MAIPLPTHPSDPEPTRLPGDFRRHPTTGAPYVSHPSDMSKKGVPKTVMYGRPSSFGTALDNAYNLVKWKERQLLIGIAEIQTRGERITVDDRDALDSLAARCHEAAGSSLAADRGTHVHLLTQRVDEGQPWADLVPFGEALGIPAALQLQIVDQWRAFRQRLGVRALNVEGTIVHDEWRLAGTYDRLDVAERDILTAFGVIEAGTTFIGDIKTGGLTIGRDGQPNYWVKYGPQLAAYVDGVPYDTDTDERGEWVYPPNPHVALIYHYDLARALAGEVVDWQAIPVSLNAGREGGNLCRLAADFAKRRDLFAMPAPIAAPTTPTVGREPAAEPPPAGSAATDDRRTHLRERYTLLADDAKRAFVALEVDPADLDAVEAALDAVDPFAQVTEPVARTPAEPEPVDPADRPVDAATITALVEHISVSEHRALINSWVGEGQQAGLPWSPRAAPTVVNYERCRAALAVAEAADGDDRYVRLIICVAWPRHRSEFVIGAAIGALDLDECARVIAVAEAFGNTLTLIFDEGGTPALVGDVAAIVAAA